MKEKASRIKLFLMDVDGVLTDGRIIMDNSGNEWKFFDVRDGHGIVLLHRIGVETGIITGRTSQAVTIRARELGIKHVLQGVHNKLESYELLKERLNLSDEEIAYIGDDVVDIPILKRVGFAVAVSDAHEDVKRFAHYITNAAGGRGAVREVAEYIIKAKGLWDEVISRYIK